MAVVIQSERSPPISSLSIDPRKTLILTCTHSDGAEALLSSKTSFNTTAAICCFTNAVLTCLPSAAIINDRSADQSTPTCRCSLQCLPQATTNHCFLPLLHRHRPRLQLPDMSANSLSRHPPPLALSPLICATIPSSDKRVRRAHSPLSSSSQKKCGRVRTESPPLRVKMISRESAMSGLKTLRKHLFEAGS